MPGGGRGACCVQRSTFNFQRAFSFTRLMNFQLGIKIRAGKRLSTRVASSPVPNTPPSKTMRPLVSFLCLISTAAALTAAPLDPIPLWPAGAPGALGEKDDDKPTLTAFLPAPEKATGAAIVMPYADTAAMNEHLAVIAARVAPGAHGVIVLDGAAWHSSRSLVTPANLTLITQPPFAPEVDRKSVV